MATKLKEHTEDLAFERFKEALESDPGRYPRGAVFIDAEAPHAKASLLRRVREGRPVVLIFPDGEERIIHADRPPEFSGGMAVVGALMVSSAILRRLMSSLRREMREAIARRREHSVERGLEREREMQRRDVDYAERGHREDAPQ